MEALHRLADQLEAAAAVVAAARPAQLDTPASAVGMQAPGRLGEITQALHRQRTAALHSREQEASTAGYRLGRLAADVRVAAAGYRRVDRDADRATRRAGGE